MSDSEFPSFGLQPAALKAGGFKFQILGGGGGGGSLLPHRMNSTPLPAPAALFQQGMGLLASAGSSFSLRKNSDFGLLAAAPRGFGLGVWVWGFRGPSKHGSQDRNSRPEGLASGWRFC